jgi:hypothetical protein
LTQVPIDGHRPAAVAKPEMTADIPDRQRRCRRSAIRHLHNR